MRQDVQGASELLYDPFNVSECALSRQSLVDLVVRILNWPHVNHVGRRCSHGDNQPPKEFGEYRDSIDEHDDASQNKPNHNFYQHP